MNCKQLKVDEDGLVCIGIPIVTNRLFVCSPMLTFKEIPRTTEYTDWLKDIKYKKLPPIKPAAEVTPIFDDVYELAG